MAFMFKCANAAHYSAKQPPRCNGGKGCVICNQKWAKAQKAKANASGKSRTRK